MILIPGEAMFIRRLIHCVVTIAGLFFLTGCSVDSSQIRFGNVYEWKQAEAYGESGSAPSSNSKRARSIAHITDNFPTPVEQARGSFFPLTAAHLSLGSFSESKHSKTDYI
jgi:hypothetical protein